MKPNFALSLSFEGIDLLHRAPDGWRAVGHASFEDPNLGGAVTALRDQAQTLAPDAITSKLILPANQVKYLALPLGNTRPAGYRALAENALEGSTPYPLHDLAIDWRAEAGTLHVAAVAKETLDEAEGFAQEHAFNPVSFTAEPAGDFPGEPFFGPTTVADSFISSAIIPDEDATAVVGPAIFPSQSPETIAAPTISVMDPAAADPVDATAAEDTSGTDNSDTGSDTGSEPSQDYTQLAHDIEDELSPAIPLSDEELELVKTAGIEDAGDQPEASDQTAAPDLFATSNAQTADAVADQSLPDAANLLAPPAPEDAKASDPSDQVADAETDAPTTSGFSFASVRARPLGNTGETSEGASAPKLDGAQRGVPFEGVRKLTLRPDRDPKAPSAAAPTPPSTPDAALSPTHALLQAADSLSPDVSDTAATALPAPVAKATDANQPATSTPDQPTTTPNVPIGAIGTGTDPTAVGGKPRHLGLILTAALLAGFVIVYGWTSLGEGGAGDLGDPGSAEQADAMPLAEDTAAASVDVPLTERALPAVEGATLEVAPDSAELSDLPPELQFEPEAPAEDALIETVDVPAIEGQPDLPDVSTAERYAASGIWDAAPDRPDTPAAASLDNLYIASIDPVVPAFDAVALPDAGRVRSDITPPAQSLPAAAGTTFSFDQRGLVTATTEGALTPDGILIYRGKPSVRPRNLPERVSPPQADAAAQDAISPAELERRAKVRPQARPENLIETNERSQLGGRTRSELAGLRPKLRPANLIVAPAQDESRLALLNSATQPLVDLSGETRDAINEAVAQSVVATSLKPKARPSNLDTSGSAPVQVASAARSQPQLPSSASVARQATVKNQLNLRKVSLIGISGKSGARNALVRMKNGRIKKVSVGDRLDGGRVTAISDGELRYKRSSRTVVLKMPRG